MAIQPGYSVNRAILVGWLVIGLSGVEAWAQAGTDVLAGSGHLRALVEHINQYSARVNAHFDQAGPAEVLTSGQENHPPVPEESMHDILAALQAEVAALEGGSLPAGDPVPVRTAAADSGRPPEAPVRPARAPPPVLEEMVPAADSRCRGHRLIPATVVANVVRILAECDLRLGQWPTEPQGFYRDYRIPVAIGLPAPGGVAQLLEVVETHFGMRGRPNRAANTIDFTYTGIPHAP